LFFNGLLLFLAGQAWDMFFPINKILWTSSYVLYSSGISLVIFSFFIRFREIKNKQILYLKIFGVNPLAVYFLAALTGRIFNIWKLDCGSAKQCMYGYIRMEQFPPEFSSLLFSLIYPQIFFLIFYILYRFKIQIKI